MSKFDFLSQQLDAYDALPQHHDQQLLYRLKQVQAWQKQRMQNSHQALFDQPAHRLMADYFLNRLYGADDFDELAFQLRRIIRNAGIVEKVIPAAALQTGDAGVELAVLSIQLDVQIAQYLMQHELQHASLDTPLTDEMMVKAYVACEQYEPRYHQMALLRLLGVKLDQYMRSRMIKTAFKLAKGAAYRYKVDPIYEFIDEGFKAMEPMKSAAEFIAAFTETEQRIMDAVHHGHPAPFSIR